MEDGGKCWGVVQQLLGEDEGIAGDLVHCSILGQGTFSITLYAVYKALESPDTLEENGLLICLL